MALPVLYSFYIGDLDPQSLKISEALSLHL